LNNINAGSFDISFDVLFPTTTTYYIQGCADNSGKVYIDGVSVLDVGGFGGNYNSSRSVTAGNHTVRLSGVNTGGPGSFACIIASDQGAVVNYGWTNGGGGGGGGPQGKPGGGASYDSPSIAGAGGDGTPSSITGSEVYYAGGGAGGTTIAATGVSNGQGATVFLGTIEVQSSNFNGTTNPANSFIKVNGTRVNFGFTRGHTIAVYNPVTLALESIDTYDTYGASNSTALNSKLTSLAVGKIVAIGSFDATSLDAATRATLNNDFGGTATNTWNHNRISHLFIGVKGASFAPVEIVSSGTAAISSSQDISVFNGGGGLGGGGAANSGNGTFYGAGGGGAGLAGIHTGGSGNSGVVIIRYYT
jgi:hypothetical protein